MSDGDALLRAILADPDDDTVRLVYADWLEENGENERAKFIRVQCELAMRPELRYCECGSARWCPVCGDCSCRTPEDGSNDSDCPLHSPSSFHAAGEMEQRLLNGGGWQDWQDGCIDLIPKGARIRDHITFRRGFVSEVRLPAAAFTEEVARTMFSRHPVTRVVFPGSIRGGTVFRGEGEDDLPQRLWEQLELPRCRLREPAHTGAGTHLHLPYEDYLSDACVNWGRELAGLPPLATTRPTTEGTEHDRR